MIVPKVLGANLTFYESENFSDSSPSRFRMREF